MLEQDGSNLQEAEALCSRSYDAVLDINSCLSGLVCEDDTPFLGRLQGPFYQYLVDHPMHVSPLLSTAANLQHVICLDKTHIPYVKQHFPEVPSVHALPLAGTPSHKAGRGDAFRERKHALLFPATYMPLEHYVGKLQEIDASLPELAVTWGERSLAGETVSVTDECVKQGYPADAIRYMERYLRELRRHTVVEELSRQGIALALCGAHWQHAPFAAQVSEILPPCDYETMLDRMSGYHAVLNVQPLFPEAPHDRVLNGMCNQAVVLTDTCRRLETDFQSGSDYLPYSFATLSEDIARFAACWRDADCLRSIARNGLETVSSQYTWRHWCEAFLTEILQIRV